MTSTLSSIIKSYASNLDQTEGQIKFGTVTSVNSANATARVMIQPEGVLSGWLPVLTQWVGNGWGMVCPPTPGDQVLIVPQEGDVEQGIIIGRVFSAKQPPPAVPNGEFWVMHQSGSFLKLCNDGTVRVSGDFYVAGDVYDRHGPLSALRTHFDAHTHVAPGGGGTTSLPTPQD